MNPRTPGRAARDILLSSLRGRRRDLSRLAGWSLVEALPALASGHLIARAIDQGFLAGQAGRGFAWLGIAGAGIVVGAWGTRQTNRRLAALVEPFRDELVTLAVTGALRRSTVPGAIADGAGVARITQQVEVVRESYASSLMVTQEFLVIMISALLGLFTLVPSLLLVVLPPVVLGIGLFVAALALMAGRQRASILVDEGFAEASRDLAEGLRDVVACGAEDTLGAALGEHIDAQARATRDVGRLAALGTVSVAIGGWLPVLLILVSGSWLVRSGATTGAVLGALTYVLQGVHPALQALVRGLAGSGMWLIVTLRRILEASEVPSGPDRIGPSGGPGREAPRGHDLRLEGVTFGYGRNADPVIRELDLVLPDGDHLAIVGPSGVGKSTLAALMTGLLVPQSGEVRLGGVPVGELDTGALATLRVLIPQQAYVFEGPLWENLSYQRPDARAEVVDGAVDLLGVGPLVRRLGGYGGTVRPSALSAGERQLITAVRAYVSPARLILLDEATCHLDPAAEARVERAFAHRPGTLVVVAHRISSALRARRILVMDGATVMVGTHDNLMSMSAQYRDLVGHWETPDLPVLSSPGR